MGRVEHRLLLLLALLSIGQQQQQQQKDQGKAGERCQDIKNLK